MTTPQKSSHVRVALVAFAVLHASGASAATTPATTEYSIVDRWTLGGSGGWDLLTHDSARHRLFITRGDRVEVVDTNSGKLTGAIAGTKGVHGVALAPDLKRGYTSNGHGNSVTEFDYDSLAVRREVAVPGVFPDAIVYEPTHRRLFVFNGESKDVVVFDATTLTVLATLSMPDNPELAVEDGLGHVFVNIESESGQIVEIDAARLVIEATWPLPGCGGPTGLAIDRMHGRLFSTCDDKTMAVTDAKTGRQVAILPIGEHPDGAAYDDVRGVVFSSNGDGSLTLARQHSPDKYSVAATLATQRGARTIALDPATGRVYLVTSEFLPAPPPTAEQPRPRPQPVPGTFVVLVVAPR
jgi:DNA-binding beta-propeller fold protein YncE